MKVISFPGKGDPDAALLLANRFKKYVGLLADRGDVAAAPELARVYRELDPLIEIANRGGSVEVATSLARINNAEVGPLKSLAESGDPVAQYEYAQLLSDERAKLAWYCRAAAQQHPDAIMAIAHHYAAGEGEVPQDVVKAFAGLMFAEQLGYLVEAGVVETYKNRRTHNACCAPQVRVTIKQRKSARLMLEAWPSGQCSE